MCSLLDVRSLINLRHTNRRAQQIVRETSVYEAVIAHALAALCVTLRTNIASWFTFSDLTKGLVRGIVISAALLVALFFSLRL